MQFSIVIAPMNSKNPRWLSFDILPIEFGDETLEHLNIRLIDRTLAKLLYELSYRKFNVSTSFLKSFPKLQSMEVFANLPCLKALAPHPASGG